MKQLVAILLVLAAGVGASRAEDAAKCRGGDGRCMDSLVAAQKRNMEESGNRVMAVAEGETVKQVQAEHDAWLKFQALACSFYADASAFGDEVRTSEQPQCEARTFGARTDELKAYLRVIDP